MIKDLDFSLKHLNQIFYLDQRYKLHGSYGRQQYLAGRNSNQGKDY